MPFDDAIAELQRCAGAQFDAAVIDALVAIVGRRPELRPARELIRLVA
jgi:HD-GYP domain-containing protein (c-di-GMP phosphodiesterase class II)